MTLFTINPSNAALSAQTVKVIQGNAPYYLLSDGTKLKNINQLLGFRMPKQDGSKGTEFIDATKSVITLSKTMQFAHIMALVVADNQAHTLPIGQLKDDDGDRVSSLGTMTAVWKNDGQVVSISNQLLTPCDGPYTLTISINNLTALTAYGAPNRRDYGSMSKTYLFEFTKTKGSSDQKITHIRPVDAGTAPVNSIYPEGYNPAVWDKDKGFSVSKMKAAGKQFPTTGFPGAAFDLIGTWEDQTRYCARSPDDSWVKTSNNRVIYRYDDSKRSKPKTPVKLDMYHLDENKNWTIIDSYTIPVPQKWAISPGVGAASAARYGNAWHLKDTTQFDALDACRKIGPRADNKITSIPEGRGQTAENRAFRQKYLYRRDELTNSKMADRTLYPEAEGSVSGAEFVVSGHSRDIGTFIGEWGTPYYYIHSPWSGIMYYWTAEAVDSYWQFYIDAGGAVARHSPWMPNKVICRGE